LWLQANSLNGLNQGDDVLNWLDQSGNNNSLSQPNVLPSPTYLTAAVNGLPALRFSKNNARIRKLNFNNFPSTSISQFFVNASNESNDGLLSYASAVNNNDFLLFSSNSLRIYRGGLPTRAYHLTAMPGILPRRSGAAVMDGHRFGKMDY